MSQKLTKVRIRTWLESKRSDQLAELREKQAKEEKTFRDSFMEKQGFTALYAKYEPSLKDFKSEWDALYDPLIENDILGSTYYSLTGDKLRKLVGQGSLGKRDFENVNIITEEYKNFSDNQDVEFEEVREEWRKLINNINALTSVKKILAYLSDLGIDTTEITPVETPQLPATPINTGILKL